MPACIHQNGIGDAAMTARNGGTPPLVAHVVHRLCVGGMENGVVNLINRMPENRYRHAVICLTEFTDFRLRIRRADVPIVALHKRQGQDMGAYLRLMRCLRKMRPAIVHTRTFATLEGQFYAALAGVRGRIHGEHGRNAGELEDAAWRRKLVRRALHPFIHAYAAVSKDLSMALARSVGISTDQVAAIYNGVDTEVFYPWRDTRPAIGPPGFVPEEGVVIGTVGRMQEVKDQPTLVRAFLHLREMMGQGREKLRLVLVGDGPLREHCGRLLEEGGARAAAWLPGECSNIGETMRAMDVFVLPSRGEGAANTLLEAMATGLPSVATRVGGNPELVQEGVTGMLVPAGDPVSMAAAIRRYVDDSGLRSAHGRNGRLRVESEFTLDSMVRRYADLYDHVLGARVGPQA